MALHFFRASPVFQDMRERADHEAVSGDDPAVRQFPRSWCDTFPVERRRQFADRAEPQIIGKDFSDEGGILWHDFKLLGYAPIAKRNRTSDPNPFAFRSGDLVPDPF